VPSYLFVVHDNDSCPDPLGRMRLTNDGEAMIVGRFMIRELIHHQATMLYAGWEMDVTKGWRAVGSIPFHPAGEDKPPGEDKEMPPSLRPGARFPPLLQAIRSSNEAILRSVFAKHDHLAVFLDIMRSFALLPLPGQNPKSRG